MGKYVGNTESMRDPFVSNLHRIVQEQRKKEFEDSEQLSLGELIEKLKTIPDPKGDKTVEFDFAGTFPTTLESYRGSYCELALGWDVSGYKAWTVKKGEEKNIPTIKQLIKELESAIGKIYQGWKGGDFQMDVDTPIWVDNSGNCNQTAIVDVKDAGWGVFLITKCMEDFS
ncbi:MAG: hypothetical protein AAB922_04490 [Patescibacteria group bacterium]